MKTIEVDIKGVGKDKGDREEVKETKDMVRDIANRPYVRESLKKLAEE